MDSMIDCAAYENWQLCQVPKVKGGDEILQFIGIFDGSLVLQSKADEPKESLLVLVPEGGLPPDEDLDDHVDGQDFDPLICAEVMLPHKGGDMMVKVLGWKHDADGNLVSHKNCIPMLDTQCYEAKFLNGEHQHIVYNVLVEHLLSGVLDSKGNKLQSFKEIVDHHKDHHAVEIADQYYKCNSCHFKKKTTTGWEMEVEWHNGSISWLPLKMLKETNPIQVADYAKANQIEMEPAFD